VKILPLFLLIGCDDTIFGKPIGDTGSSAPIENPTYNDVQAIFNAHCTSCHSGAVPASSLDLTVGASALVGISSTEDPATLLVQTGNADASYLYQKLIGTQATGNTMPIGGSLSDADIGTIYNWIMGGAEPLCSYRTEATKCAEDDDDDERTYASVALPEGALVCYVTLYGVAPTGPDEQYTDVEATMDVGDYYVDDGTLYADCPPIDGDWSWRSFVVTYGF